MNLPLRIGPPDEVGLLVEIITQSSARFNERYPTPAVPQGQAYVLLCTYTGGLKLLRNNIRERRFGDYVGSGTSRQKSDGRLR